MTQTTPQPVRLMSFNVRNMRSNDGPNSWEHRRELLVEVIRRFNPDVLGTQEAYAPQVEYLAEALPDYTVAGVGRDDGDREGEFCAVYYRSERFRAVESGTFWFSDTPDLPGSRHWTPHHARICTWVRLDASDREELLVANLHLDHESQPARENSAQLLIERILRPSGRTPVVVMGDFNVTDDNSTIRALLTTEVRAMRDSFRLMHPHDESSGTFHGYSGAFSGERIDYILTSHDIEVLEASIVHDGGGGRLPSDHFPVTAVVEISRQ